MRKRIRDYVIRQSLLCAVTYFDESSKISPALAARVHVVYKRIVDVLILEAEAKEEEFIYVMRHRKDKEYYEQFLHRLCSRLSEHAVEVLNNELMYLSEFGRLLPYQGIHYDKTPDKKDCEGEIAYLYQQNNLINEKKAISKSKVIVLCFRIDCQERLRNLLACIYSIRSQDIGRENIFIVAVNQDKEDYYKSKLEKYVDAYVFAENKGIYNYSWARNIGANIVKDAEYYIFWDIDILAPKDLVRRIDSVFQTEEVQSIVPYESAYNVDDVSTSYFISEIPDYDKPNCFEYIHAQIMHEVYGMMIATRAKEFYDIGGQDERYEGWGDEDNDFYQRLYIHGKVRRLNCYIFHLDHPRPVMRINGEKINMRLIGDLKERDDSIGNIKKYSDE